MKIAFLGTPEFAVPSLERCVDAGYDVVAVVTQPDRPKGRGNKLTPPPVKVRALELGLDVHQLAKLKPPDVVEWFRSLNVEAMAVVAYGKILAADTGETLLDSRVVNLSITGAIISQEIHNGTRDENDIPEE